MLKKILMFHTSPPKICVVFFFFLTCLYKRRERKFELVIFVLFRLDLSQLSYLLTKILSHLSTRMRVFVFSNNFEFKLGRKRVSFYVMNSVQ
jgi:hypothetical protein